MQLPTEHDVKRIVHQALGKNAQTIKRFPTGLAHYVYEVSTADHELLVVRLSRGEMKPYFQGALRWYPILQQKGVPLPKLLYAELNEGVHGFPVMIMERLPGTDLGIVYPLLSLQQKQAIADRIIRIQQTVATLPHAQGYGYGFGYEDSSLQQSWTQFLEKKIERARARIAQTGVVPLEFVDTVQQRIHSYKMYFSQVQPVAFLDDLTTKNVLITPDGTVSGVVDADGVTFGDALLTIALTRVSLLAKGYDTDYTEYWSSKLQLSSSQHTALAIYSALFGIEFLSEIGQTFNKEQAGTADPAHIQRLVAVVESFT